MVLTEEQEAFGVSSSFPQAVPSILRKSVPVFLPLYISDDSRSSSGLRGCYCPGDILVQLHICLLVILDFERFLATSGNIRSTIPESMELITYQRKTNIFRPSEFR